MKLKLQGGFSTATAEAFQDYANQSVCFGYVGSGDRTKERDVLLEKQLRFEGLKERGIALWLTSTTARHMMDNIEKDTTASEFTQIVARYTKDAFVQVAVWSHPDHEGSLDSTEDITSKLRMALR